MLAARLLASTKSIIDNRHRSQWQQQQRYEIPNNRQYDVFSETTVGAKGLPQAGGLEPKSCIYNAQKQPQK